MMEQNMDGQNGTSEGFQMRYNASEHKTRSQEIERIRSQYAAHEQKKDGKEVDELEQLRKLDERAKTPALVVSLSLGVGGTLILGLGMSMCLAMDLMILGIIIGVLGMVILSLAFPAHQYLLKKGKEKYGEEICRLCEVLEEEE